MCKEKELLRKQLELLAEQSKGATDRELSELSIAMCEVYKELKRNNWMNIALLLTAGLNLLICILVHI